MICMMFFYHILDEEVFPHLIFELCFEFLGWYCVANSFSFNPVAPYLSLTQTENSMAVLPSSICKLKKARGGGGGGLFRTGSNGSRKGNHSNSGDGEDEDDPYRSEMEDSDNTESPPEPLPLYQQRENYFT